MSEGKQHKVVCEGACRNGIAKGCKVKAKARGVRWTGMGLQLRQT